MNIRNTKKLLKYFKLITAIQYCTVQYSNKHKTIIFIFHYPWYNSLILISL